MATLTGASSSSPYTCLTKVPLSLPSTSFSTSLPNLPKIPRHSCFSVASSVPARRKVLCTPSLARDDEFGDLVEIVDNEAEIRRETSEMRLYSLSPFPLLFVAALPGAGTVRSLFGPFVELIKSWSLPDWLVHWGHPGNMAVVLFAMGGYGTYLGFRIRYSDNAEEKANAKDLHPKLLGGMDDQSSTEAVNGQFDKVLSAERERNENQVEIDRLKFMLHQKELELSQLKEQLERDQLALSALHIKAETEVSKAQKLIFEKDTELLAAEDSLSGLEEVHIHYRGEGEIIEVAGSFNGWHHKIKMDPQPSSDVVDSINSKNPRLWSTVLWLYPGVYEIKFVVDGQWKIDPHRESVTNGAISNNILRVRG